MRHPIHSLAAVLLAGACTASAADAPPQVSDKQWHEPRGVWRYTVESPLQKGKNTLEVLTPEKFDPARPHRVVYVLPVETGIAGRWGDGLMEIKKHGLHTRHDVICVGMSFDTIPWYTDHAADPHVRQESYLKQVVAIIEQRYKTPGDRDGRLLLGFSKSGWGAVAMVLRNPDFFGYAAAWDAPLMLKDDDWTNFEIPRACGTKERFAEYRLTGLVERAPADFKRRTRLAILGEKNFGPAPGRKYAPAGHTKAFHDLLTTAGIPHEYRDDLNVDHHWETGWVKPAFDLLIGMAKAK